MTTAPARTGPGAKTISPLTEAQRRAAAHLILGRTNEEIAAAEHVTPATVTHHLGTLRQHLGCGRYCSRPVLARAVLMHRHVDPPPLPGTPPVFDQADRLLLHALARHSWLKDIARAAGLPAAGLRRRIDNLVHRAHAADSAHLVALAHSCGVFDRGPDAGAQPTAAAPSGGRPTTTAAPARLAGMARDALAVPTARLPLPHPRVLATQRERLNKSALAIHGDGPVVVPYVVVVEGGDPRGDLALVLGYAALHGLAVTDPVIDTLSHEDQACADNPALRPGYARTLRLLADPASPVIGAVALSQSSVTADARSYQAQLGWYDEHQAALFLVRDEATI
ncbi:hypothetical protein AB0C52_33185 [Streptomyces sp. NPDC048717]|uniref:hypothetical protein n=1 Tax=Streptomyces sp. NPDC048717 TaxID=3154928 RepID=UPI00342AA7DE